MENGQFLDFKNFIITYFPTYRIDDDNIRAISQISLWAFGDPSFEDEEKGWYLDKGICLSGNVGTGKTDLFYLFKMYLGQYLKSNRRFASSVVWQFTSEFNQKGYESLKNEHVGNVYYDELCMIDKRTNFPTKEQAINYGQKILVGEELIMVRYNAFKTKNKFQTHFSTNATESQIEDIYGERAYSRLNEMCNFMFLTGDNRRMTGKSTSVSTLAQTNFKSKKDITPQEMEENKNMLDAEFREFLATGNVRQLAWFDYDLLKQYGCSVCSEEDIELFKEEAEKQYVESISRGSAESKAKDKSVFIWKEARIMAVRKYYELLKQSGSQSIFGIVQVSLGSIKINNSNVEIPSGDEKLDL